MAFGYLFLALILAVTLNHANGLVRASGALIAALSLAFIVLSIILADIDGTFAAFAARASGLGALGLTVLVLVVFRLAWFVASPAPALSQDLTTSERFLARAARLGLYVLIIGLPVSGLLMNLFRGEAVDVYGASAPPIFAPEAGAAAAMSWAHDAILPLAFYAAIFAHVGAAAKHHFLDRRVADIHRMVA